MDGVEDSAANRKIEWDFRYDSKNENSAQILPKVFRVKVPFNDQKSKNRKTDPPDAGQPVISRYNRTP